MFTWNKMWAEYKEAHFFPQQYKFHISGFELRVMKLMILSKTMAGENKKIKHNTK